MASETTRDTSGEGVPAVAYMAACNAVAIVGLTIMTPLIPLVAEDLQVSSGAVQNLLTLYLMAIGISHLVCGPLSDRFGRRPVLLLGTLCFTIGSVAMTLTDNIDLLGIARVTQGIGAGAGMAMIRAMINDVYNRSEAARLMSLISMVLALAPAVSVAFGGLVAGYTAWQTTMVLLAVAGALLCAYGLRHVKETHQKKTATINIQSVARAYQSVLSSPTFLCWTLASGMQVGVFFVLNGVLAYQYQRHGYSMAEFGFWFSLTPLSYLVGNYLNRLWFVEKGIEKAALLGCALSVISILAMLLSQSAGMTSALSLALPCSLFGLSNGIVVANTTVGAISSLDSHIGTASGLVGAWQMTAGGIAGAIIVWLGGAENFLIAVIALLFMCLVSVLCMFSIVRLNKVHGSVGVEGNR